MNIQSNGNLNIQAGRDVLIAEGDIRQELSSYTGQTQNEMLEALKELKEGMKKKDSTLVEKTLTSVINTVPKVAAALITKVLCS